MKDRLGAHPLPIQLPIGAEADFKGVVDLVTERALVWNDELGTEWEEQDDPGRARRAAHEARTHLIEACADYDDELMEAYLAEEEISPERIKAALRQATLDIKVTPVLCGSSFKNKGVQPLLDAVIDYLPSPLDVPPVTGIEPVKGDEEGREAERPADDNAPFAALAFKVMADPYVGKLTYFRVYSGTLQTGSKVLNASTGRQERVGRILEMHANHREEREDIFAGDIVAGRRPQADLDRRHAVRPRGADQARDDRVPGAGDRGLDRAQDQGRPGEARHRARAPGRGGPDLPGPLRRGDRPDADLRHGRAAPRGDRRPA